VRIQEFLHASVSREKHHKGFVNSTKNMYAHSVIVPLGKKIPFPEVAWLTENYGSLRVLTVLGEYMKGKWMGYFPEALSVFDRQKGCRTRGVIWGFSLPSQQKQKSERGSLPGGEVRRVVAGRVPHSFNLDREDEMGESRSLPDP